MLSLGEINALDQEGFVIRLGPVFEHSPWIVERAWLLRPFASAAALHAAMAAVIRDASLAERLALLSAHPDLAGKAARAGALTAESAGEQRGAGLDQLTNAEFARFERLNRAYRARFGIPFIIAVRGRGKAEILAAFERRVGSTAAAEMNAALGEVAEIGRLRLERLLLA